MKQLKTGFRFTFPDEQHVKLTALTPAGELSVTLTWCEMDEVMVQVMRRMGDARAREFAVEVGEEALGES